MGEAQRCLEFEVKVIPAQPAFPACWADRGKGASRGRRGGDSHRKPTESNRPREKHTGRESKVRHCNSKHKHEQPRETPATLRGVPRTDKQYGCPPVPSREGGVGAARRARWSLAARDLRPQPDAGHTFHSRKGRPSVPSPPPPATDKSLRLREASRGFTVERRQQKC